MNDLAPEGYLWDVPAKIAARYPMSCVDELLPFAHAGATVDRAVA